MGSDRRQGRAHRASAWLALALAGTLCTAAAAQDTKIGYVNTERILRDAAPAKAALAKIEQEFGRRDKELAEMANRLKSMGEKLDRDGTVMQESERNRRQREFAEQEKDFQRKQREFREDLNQRRNEELAQVVERAQRVIKQVAEQDKFDLVVGDAVFVNPRIDITDKVIRALAGNAGQAK